MKFFFLILLLVIANTQYYAQSKFTYLEKYAFNNKTHFITQFAFASELLIVGFKGESNNVSIYLRFPTQPKNPEKQGILMDFNFLTNLTEATGNITSITSTLNIGLIGISSMDHILRLYQIKQQIGKIEFDLVSQIKDPSSGIILSAMSYQSFHLATVNQEGILKFYAKKRIDTINQQQKENKSSSLGVNNKSSTKTRKLKNPGWRIQMITEMNPPNQIYSMMFAFNQTSLYVGYDNGTVVVYCAEVLPYRFVYCDHFTHTNKKITSIAMDTQNKYLITGSEDTFIRVYKIDVFLNVNLIQGIYDANKPITKIQMKKTSHQFLASSEDGYARLYSFNQEKGKFQLQSQWNIGQKDRNFGITYCPFGNLMAIAGQNQINIYESCSFAITNCSDCSNLLTCKSCANNYYLDQNGFCSQCALFQGCKTCVKQNQCTSCYSGYFLNVQIGVCQPCSNSLKNCKTCSSKYDCIQCFMQFQLRKGVCQFPLNPSITPLITNNKTLTVKQIISIPSSNGIRSQQWTITLIVLIIILCTLISVMIIIMIVISVKLFKRLKKTNNDLKSPSVKQNISKPISQKYLDPNNLPQLQPIPYDQKQDIIDIPIALQPEEKGQDIFQDLRP